MKYSLSLEDKDLQLVLNSLVELPYKLSSDLIADILRQVQAQNAPRETDGNTQTAAPLEIR